MPSEYDEIRFQVVMARLLDHYGIEGRKCPLCGKKAFSAYEDGKGFQCFACKVKGGCFDLVMHIEKVSLVRAKEILRGLFSPAAHPIPARERRPFEQLDEWVDNLVVLREKESPEEWAERVRNAIKTKFLESYKAGQKTKAPSRA